MSDTYGLIIKNAYGNNLCDGEHPAMGVLSTVNTQTYWPAISYGVTTYGMIASYPLVLGNYPVGAVPCYDFTSYHYSSTNGIGFMTNNGVSQPCHILQPNTQLTPASPGTYGLEVYDSVGRVLWTTNRKQFIVREVIAISAATIQSMLSTLSLTPVRITYPPVANPVYILSGFTAYRPDFGRYYPYYSSALVRKAAVKHVGAGALDMLWTVQYYGYSDGNYYDYQYQYYVNTLSTIPQVSTTQYIIVGELL